MKKRRLIGIFYKQNYTGAMSQLGWLGQSVGAPLLKNSVSKSGYASFEGGSSVRLCPIDEDNSRYRFNEFYVDKTMSMEELSKCLDCAYSLTEGEVITVYRF